MYYKLKRNKSKDFIRLLINIENKSMKEKDNLRKNYLILLERLH